MSHVTKKIPEGREAGLLFFDILTNSQEFKAHRLLSVVDGENPCSCDVSGKLFFKFSVVQYSSFEEAKKFLITVFSILPKHFIAILNGEELR